MMFAMTEHLLSLNEQEAEKLICYHWFLYSIADDPYISNEEFDLLLLQLKERFPDSRLLNAHECPIAFYSKFYEQYEQEQGNLVLC